MSAERPAQRIIEGLGASDALGLFTFERLLQTAIEDAIYVRGINRIRHYYVDLVPEMARYFVLSTYDDGRGMMLEMGLLRFHRLAQSFLTNATMVAFINSVVASVVVGVSVGLLADSMALAVGTGIAAFLGCMVLHMWYQDARWAALEREMPALFPTPSSKENSPSPSTTNAWSNSRSASVSASSPVSITGGAPVL